MNSELRKSIEHLIEAHPVLKQGRKAEMSEITDLNRECGGIIPEWLIELLTSYPLCGAQFGWESPDLAEEAEEDLKNLSWTSALLYLAKKDSYPLLAWVDWSTPEAMREVMLETHIGIELLKHGYINVAQDGSTCDPYFVPINRGDNPPLFVVSACAPEDADLIMNEELSLVSETLSDLFLKIKEVEILNDHN
jgi:hypothetical protein